MRFKIDLYDSFRDPFALYVERKTLFGSKWDYIDRFETRDKAKAFYEKIKDLPEYLD